MTPPPKLNKEEKCPYCNYNLPLDSDPDRKIFEWHLSGHPKNMPQGECKHQWYDLSDGYKECQKCGECVSQENKEWSEEKDTEVFMDLCDLYRDYFNKAEIEGMDIVIGHLAVIGRDYVHSQEAKIRREMVEKINDEYIPYDGKEYSKNEVNMWNSALDKAIEIIKS